MKKSFRYKFILSFVLLEALFLSLILYFNFNFINNYSYKQVESSMDSTRSLTTNLLLVPVSSYDLATVDNILHTILKLKNVKGIKVVDFNDNTLSFQKNIDILTDYKEVVIPLILANQKIADIHMWIDFTDDYKTINEYKSNVLIIIFIQLIISFILSYIIGHRISVNLEKLAKNAEKLGNNENLELELIKSNDEISILSKSMINMQEKIKDRTRKLKDLNTELDSKIKVEVEKSIEKDRILSEQSKLAAMGEMIGNIAHQWRQPLSIISSSATALLVQKEHKMLDDNSLDTMCNQINNSAQYLSKTIDDFREFVKGEEGKRKFILDDLINSVTTLMKPVLKGNDISLIIDMPKGIEIESYQNELVQCFINILNNSKDAFREKEFAQKIIVLNIYQKKDYLVFDFIDNAGGVTSEILSKIYEPYYTTKHKSMGTGLGLSIVHKLITNGINGNVQSNNKEFKLDDKVYTGLNTVISIPLQTAS